MRHILFHTVLMASLVGTLMGADKSLAIPKNPASERLTVAQVFASLPDFSHAGYACGEKPLPSPPVVASVRQFGAKGDGKTDDTKAFERALATAKPGALLIPAGTYLLSRPLTLSTNGVVLRGEGMNKTMLRFTQSLTDIEPKPTKNSGGTPTTAYSWSGGMLRLKGNGQKTVVAKVDAVADRGTTQLHLAADSHLQVGQSLRLEIKDNGDRSLGQYLLDGQDDNLSKWNGIHAMQSVRITAIQGRTVTLDRPLRFDLRLQWQPQLISTQGELTQAGVEKLSISFAPTAYGGHFKEVGFNAIEINNAVHCFLRQLRIENADSGIFLRGHQCTMTDITLTSKRKKDNKGHTGHHGIGLGGCDNLLSGFDFKTRFIHDITVSNGSMGNVVEDGKADDLALDHHCCAPYENLFCQIDAGAGTRLYASGGGQKIGRHCGARTVFWGIWASNPLPAPPKNWAPTSLTLVGVTQAPSRYRSVFVPHKKLEPANPRLAQLRQRMGRH